MVSGRPDDREAEIASVVKEGPPIEELTRHLAECPQSFLAEPIQPNGSGEVHVAAVVSDLMRMMGGGPLSQKAVESLSYSSTDRLAKERNRLRLSLVVSWLASNSHLVGKCSASKLLKLFLQGLDDLAKLVPTDSFVSDPERREELSRLLLDAVGLIPQGENENEAENRLDALSTVKREAVVKAAKAAEQRARKLREELAAKERAQRAASVYSHE
jgi:hypothetical protein